MVQAARYALGGMLMAKFAGWTLQATGSYTLIFIVAASAYLAALLIVQVLGACLCAHPKHRNRHVKSAGPQIAYPSPPLKRP